MIRQLSLAGAEETPSSVSVGGRVACGGLVFPLEGPTSPVGFGVGSTRVVSVGLGFSVGLGVSEGGHGVFVGLGVSVGVGVSVGFTVSVGLGVSVGAGWHSTQKTLCFQSFSSSPFQNSL